MKKREQTPKTTEESTVNPVGPDAPEEQKAPEEIPADGQQAADSEQKAGGEQEAGIDEWRAALETAVKQRDEYLDSLRRTQADFQNFRRRNQTTRADGYMDGVCESMEALLPAIDNLERAIQHADPETESALLTGVKMTLTQIFDNMRRLGLEEVPALGEDFDPEKHNAVMREPGDPAGKVLEVLQKGYRVKDKIIRYAMVKVSVEE